MNCPNEGKDCLIIPFPKPIPKVRKASTKTTRPKQSKTRKQWTLLAFLLDSFYDEVDPGDLVNWSAIGRMEGNGRDISR